MAGKPRVHELAKELGVESKTVLAKLKEMGEFVKSASSTIEAPVARRLRATMEAAGVAGGGARGAPPAPATEARRPEPGRPPPTQGARPKKAPAPARRRRSVASRRAPTTSRWRPPRRAPPQLKAEQEAAVRAAQERGRGARPVRPRPGPAAGARPAPGAGRGPRPGAPAGPRPTGAPGPGGRPPPRSGGNNPFGITQGSPSGAPGAGRPAPAGMPRPNPASMPPRPNPASLGGRGPTRPRCRPSARVVRVSGPAVRVARRSRWRSRLPRRSGRCRSAGWSRWRRLPRRSRWRRRWPVAASVAVPVAAAVARWRRLPRRSRWRRWSRWRRRLPRRSRRWRRCSGGRWRRSSRWRSRRSWSSGRCRRCLRARRRQAQGSQVEAAEAAGVRQPVRADDELGRARGVRARSSGCRAARRSPTSLSKINANPGSLVQEMFNLGEMVTATQSCTDETLLLLGEHLGFDVQIVSPEEEDRELLARFDIDLDVRCGRRRGWSPGRRS